MELGLSGKVALVTGSSRGIGRGVALALAHEGCNVLLTGRDAGALEEVAAAARGTGVKAAVVALDLRESGAPVTLIETARRELGGLDMLVNNAGATRRGDFFALSDADWQMVCTRSSPMCGCRAAALLRERGRWLDRGNQRTQTGGSFTIAASMRPARSARRWPIWASPTGCRSTASIRAWSIPTARDGASRPRCSAPASLRPRSGRSSAATPASRGSAPRRMWPASSASSSPRTAAGCTAPPSISTAAKSKFCDGDFFHRQAPCPCGRARA